MSSVPGKLRYKKVGRYANIIGIKNSFELLKWFGKDLGYLSLWQGIHYCWYLVFLFNLPSQIIYIIKREAMSSISSGWINGEKG